MQVEMWPIDRPIPYARNARTIPQSAIDKCAASIKEFGFRQPIVVDKEGVIVAGHTRILASQKLALKQIPVHVASELTHSQIRAYRLADNRVAQEASFNDELLSLELADLKLEDFDLSLTGFDEGELVSVLGEGYHSGESRGEDAVPEVPDKVVSAIGDLWALGSHRLLCGNSTNKDDIGRVTGGRIPDLVFSDPPYGISIVNAKNIKQEVGGGGIVKFGKVGGGGIVKFGKVGGGIVDAKIYAQVVGDDTTKTAQDFYNACLAFGLKDLIVWGGNYFTTFLPASACWIVWDKKNSGNFADVELAWTSFNRAAKLYSFMWNGLAREGDRKTELSSRVHPTQKPVGLFESIFADFEFKSCLDGFLGSGSTLIACEKTNRLCYGIEISPVYCDVIVKRWQDFTGKRAVHEDGTLFDERTENHATSP